MKGLNSHDAPSLNIGCTLIYISSYKLPSSSVLCEKKNTEAKEAETEKNEMRRRKKPAEQEKISEKLSQLMQPE